MDWINSFFSWPGGIALTISIVISVYLFFSIYKPTIKHYTYKITPQGDLKLRVYLPQDWSADDHRPAILFFFGGGWIGGGINHFSAQAEYLAKRGMVATLIDYRIDSKHHTTPDKAVEDGLDAMKWIADNAGKLGIDTDKIIASGASAGGHIATCLALCNTKETDKKSGMRPSLLVLFNPVLDLTNATAELEFSSRELELIEAIGPDVARAISPNQHINEQTPDTLMVFGENDPLLQQASDFILIAKQFGTETQLLVAPNNGHGFFNKEPWKSSTMRAIDQYLVEKSYLSGEPRITSAINEDASLQQR
jgi:acetyl esterase/lipase